MGVGRGPKSRRPGGKLSHSGIRNRGPSELLLEVSLQLQAKRKSSGTKTSSVGVVLRRNGLRLGPPKVSRWGSWHTRGSQTRLRAGSRCGGKEHKVL